MDQCPDEILREIFSFFDIYRVMKCKVICKRWRKIIILRGLTPAKDPNITVKHVLNSAWLEEYQPCRWCYEPTSAKCSKCWNAFFCSKKCIKRNWSSHKWSCLATVQDFRQDENADDKIIYDPTVQIRKQFMLDSYWLDQGKIFESFPEVLIRSYPDNTELSLLIYADNFKSRRMFLRVVGRYTWTPKWMDRPKLKVIYVRGIAIVNVCDLER